MNDKYEIIDERTRAPEISLVTCKITLYGENGKEVVHKFPLPKKTRKAFGALAGFLDWYESVNGEPVKLVVEFFGVPQEILSRIKKMRDNDWEIAMNILRGKVPPLGLALLVRRLYKRYGDKAIIRVNGEEICGGRIHTQ